jgi:hypothetical protein
MYLILILTPHFYIASINLYSNPTGVRGKNPTAFYEKENREKRIGKSFKSFIYFLIGRNLCANCYRNLRVGYGKIPCLKSFGKS